MLSGAYVASASLRYLAALRELDGAMTNFSVLVILWYVGISTDFIHTSLWLLPTVHSPSTVAKTALSRIEFVG